MKTCVDRLTVECVCVSRPQGLIQSLFWGCRASHEMRMINPFQDPYISKILGQSGGVRMIRRANPRTALSAHLAAEPTLVLIPSVYATSTLVSHPHLIKADNPHV